MRDVSHPECEAQLEDVMTVLEKQLNIKAPLFDSMIEAQNKIDLWYASLARYSNCLLAPVYMYFLKI